METSVKTIFTPIRYDFDSNEAMYTEGIHPHSHVHFGLNNEIRVGTTRVWTPLTFVLFIIRQCFRNEWLRVVMHSKAAIWANNIRGNLKPSPKALGSKIDEMEAVLY
jgi:hypothetical protein